MEIVGKIIQILPLQEGVSARTGNPWQLQTYVLETQENYPKKVCFEVFGSDRIKANECKEGDLVTVSFDLESREFNGRWYTSVRAWKIQQGAVATTPVAAAAPAAATSQTPATPAAVAPQQATTDRFDDLAAENEGDGDLPF